MKTAIDQLIINSPYEEPKHYWSYDRESRTFSLKDGRRPAQGRLMLTAGSANGKELYQKILLMWQGLLRGQ